MAFLFWRWDGLTFVLNLIDDFGDLLLLVDCLFIGQGFQVLVVRCGCRCLMENGREWNDQMGDCECCGAHLSGTQGSAHGDHGCAPLQRINTYTTCTGGNNVVQQQQNGKNLPCRVLLPNNSNNHNNHQHFTGPSPVHHQHQHRAAYKSSYSGRFQHQQQQEGGGPQARGRCCSSFNSTANSQRRYSPSSSLPAACGANANYSRSASRPQKFVFRTNFPTQQQSSCQQAQRLLSGAGAGSPASIIIQSGVNTTAESHIWKRASLNATITVIWPGERPLTPVGQITRTKEIWRENHMAV